jgi:hypothetical protein
MEVMLITSTVITALFLLITLAEAKCVKKTNISKDIIKEVVLVYVCSLAGLVLIDKLNIFKLKKKSDTTKVFTEAPEF